MWCNELITFLKVVEADATRSDVVFDWNLDINWHCWYNLNFVKQILTIISDRLIFISSKMFQSLFKLDWMNLWNVGCLVVVLLAFSINMMVMMMVIFEIHWLVLWVFGFVILSSFVLHLLSVIYTFSIKMLLFNCLSFSFSLNPLLFSFSLNPYLFWMFQFDCFQLIFL